MSKNIKENDKENIERIKLYYDAFLGTSETWADKFFQKGSIKSEDKAKSIISIFQSAMANSLNAIQLEQNLKLKEEEFGLREAQSQKDLDVKEAQRQKIYKDRDLVQEHINDRTKKRPTEIEILNCNKRKVCSDATFAENSRQKRHNLLTEQINQTKANTALLKEKKTQLIQSVKDNKLLRQTQFLGDTIGRLATGEMIPPPSMVSKFLSNVAATSTAGEISPLYPNKYDK